MEARAVLEGLPYPQEELLGDPTLCIAVLDGPVDLEHPCFAGANLVKLPTLVSEPGEPGPMSLHGTHVASLLFGQPGSSVAGLTPRCRGLILPVFPDGENGRVSQLDLARAIERAVAEGAHVINISGGEPVPDGKPNSILERALRLCDDNGVLVVAAVGNDGADGVQVPAAVPSVLAVGATGIDGEPLMANNWGEAYRAHGVLAPGLNIAGAAPGGGRKDLTGSSFATPIVSGLAALLASTQINAGLAPNPRAVNTAILEAAIPCDLPDDIDRRRCLGGVVNAARAFNLIRSGRGTAVTESDVTPIAQPAELSQATEATDSPVAAVSAAGEPAQLETHPAASDNAAPSETVPHAAATTPAAAGSSHRRGVAPSSADCSCPGKGAQQQLIYVIGKIGFDFRTEARRDSFLQQMDPFTFTNAEGEAAESPANPYDPNQLSNYLTKNPWASDKVTWTVNMERSPLYALEAEMPVGMDWGEPVVDPTWQEDRLKQVAGNTGELAQLLSSFAFPPVSHVYKMLRDAIVGQARPVDDAVFVSRVSIPGILTDRTVRLFSGQVVPVVEVKARGIHTWNETALVNAVTQQVVAENADVQNSDAIRKNIQAFLDKIYYQFRNLGQTPADRAMNYAGTNAFMLGGAIQQGILSGSYVPGENSGFYTLDTITVSKSPYDRIDSDCWDVVTTFFDPENDRRAKVSYLLTVDVSDHLPVSLAPVHRFLGGL